MVIRVLDYVINTDNISVIHRYGAPPKTSVWLTSMFGDGVGDSITIDGENGDKLWDWACGQADAWPCGKPDKPTKTAPAL